MQKNTKLFVYYISQLASLDFVVNRFFMKLFKTTDMQVVRMCREHFDFVLPSEQLDRRRRSFVGSPVTTDLIKFVLLDVLYVVNCYHDLVN